MFMDVFCKNGHFYAFINNQYFIKFSQKSKVFSRYSLSGKVTHGLTANLDLCVDGYVCLGFLGFFEGGDIRTKKSGVKICDFLIGSNPIKPH